MEESEHSLTPPQLRVTRACHPGRAGGDMHLRIQTSQIQASPVGLNTTPRQRSFPSARLRPWRSSPLCFTLPALPPLPSCQGHCSTQGPPSFRPWVSPGPSTVVCVEVLQWICTPHCKWYGHHCGRSHADTQKCAFSPGWSAPLAKEPAPQGDRRWEQSGAWLIYSLKSLKCSQGH